MGVKLYSTPFCSYCIKAKRWFLENKIDFEEISLVNQDAIEQFKKDCPGKKTVPQILINEVLFEDGYNGLIENAKKIKELLNS